MSKLFRVIIDYFIDKSDLISFLFDRVSDLETKVKELKEK